MRSIAVRVRILHNMASIVFPVKLKIPRVSVTLPTLPSPSRASSCIAYTHPTRAGSQRVFYKHAMDRQTGCRRLRRQIVKRGVESK